MYKFSRLPDKQKAWNDFIRLAADRNIHVKRNAISALDSVFSQITDKQQAWNELHRLTNDQDSDLRQGTAYSLGAVFSQLPDKQQAWNDLHRLITDGNSRVKRGATYTLGLVFSQLSSKEQAWNDLQSLANDKDRGVRLRAASAIGSIFYHIPDKQQAWNELHRLTNDQDTGVKAYANHSLGEISIFKASQAEKEEDYKRELEEAIEFFEIAAQEDKWGSPSQFCLPFYRSFHTIIFKRQEAQEEVGKYLAEAKEAVRGSKSKELLFEAVENLANALKEVQNSENLNLEAKKDELKFYKKYCDRAVELMRDTEETAPFATIAMRKGLPILDRNLKELLEEIQRKARIACNESKGTDAEEIACTINREIQTWEIGNQEEMTFNVENLVFTLEANTPHNPQNNFLLDRIKQIPEQKDVSKQYNMLSSIITLIINSCLEQKLQDIGEKVDKVSDKLEEITISLKPGISEELIIHVGPISQWGGVEYTLTIPLQDISYPELKEDLQKIMGKKIDKLSKMPSGLAGKVRDYLIQKNMWSFLDKLT
ncbi:HEAT repeat domain-containing protein [Methanosarcina sp. MSH10X1]|nr:HEAT repeat domain-containing protein [Methanosarcina sp. MSH10X1]